MIQRWKDERGAVTAEFAVTIPAVLMILSVVIGAVMLSAQKISLTSLTHEIARLEARGDINTAAQLRHRLPEGATIERLPQEGILCLKTLYSPDSPLLRMVRIESKGCAAIVEGLDIQ